MAKTKAPKEADWKGPGKTLLLLCIFLMFFLPWFKEELEHPPEKVGVDVLAHNLVQGVKDVGNDLIDLSRRPMYIEQRDITPGGHRLGPSNRVTGYPYRN